MIAEKSLVIYKSKPALVVAAGDKIDISVLGGEKLKVREKDIELIHPGPCTLAELNTEALSRLLAAGDAKGAWELLEGGGDVPLRELAELVYGEFTPTAAWAAYSLILDGLYFTGNAGAVKPRPSSEVEADEKKRGEKQREADERAAFFERLKKAAAPGADGSQAHTLSGDVQPENPLVEGDRRYLQDVEALALGRTDKSRTLKELGRSETPQEAHRLLLAAGVWTVWDNPHPSRFGLSLQSAKIIPDPAPDEDRLDLTHLKSYAIDNAWSDDPDDAVSLEGPETSAELRSSEGSPTDSQGRLVLWVHVADPAASIKPGSPADLEARGRGATLYVPEGSARMLAPEALPLFALGLGADGICPALSFKIVLNAAFSIVETEIIPSKVKVTRLTYEEADNLEGGELAGLFALAARNTERRLDTGAILIDLPDAHIHVHLDKIISQNKVSVEALVPRKSADMVRECMVLAGEGAARWALRNKVPFPFVGQEAGELPEERLAGLAGAFQLRRCMRPRTLSAKPAIHWGLGLDEYTQVTSPLRRYTDLLCHQQIRAFLKGEALLSEEEILLRVGAAEAAAFAAGRAERASKAHWMGVYLLDKKGSEWEAIVLDKKGGKAVASIPALGLETQVGLKGDVGPNDSITLACGSARIPEGEVNFTVL
ncbi:ribonuclease catalytic domain-containing protein [Leadbettera azotonutricia]|uniref:Ribonuclease II family protein n=1 Tax=Leadbettera azotonutricia (strain ATCC BAA-888 / DSM 13862 / ZAS-9) TaxID=545695 RepID=F5YG07_LEAAZ|nr:RNB domain-containing ribonuclease [Leadbettera azotonutricia]AEF81542.1 ribonuclease II family protein [Leadbettera azotonutricia ZAS-9]